MFLSFSSKFLKITEVRCFQESTHFQYKVQFLNVQGQLNLRVKNELKTINSNCSVADFNKELLSLSLASER